MKIVSRSAGKTRQIGRLLAKGIKKGDIICLFGSLGSGKTELTKGIAQGLGIKSQEIISPTFVLLRRHLGSVALYHFDLYRLERVKDILNLGYEEFLYNDAVSVIEWADRLKCLLPKEYLKINLKVLGKTMRRIEIEPVGERYGKFIELIKKN